MGGDGVDAVPFAQGLVGDAGGSIHGGGGARRVSQGGGIETNAGGGEFQTAPGEGLDQLRFAGGLVILCWQGGPIERPDQDERHGCRGDEETRPEGVMFGIS